MPNNSFKMCGEAGEMVPVTGCPFRGMGSGPSTHMITHNYLQVPRYLTPLLITVDTSHTWYTHAGQTLSYT